MQVRNFEISVIEAKRFSKAGEKVTNIRIDHNSAVTQISRGPDGTALVDYRFTSNYAGLGFIKIEGQLVLQGDVEPLLDEWTKKGSMPPEWANLVHNTVVPNCIPTALLVARDIRLPPPVPMPHINIQQPQLAKRPSPSPEIT
ncbi:MAG: hypothetical protein QW520_00990 [Methanomassiliicoccales archaeon]